MGLTGTSAGPFIQDAFDVAAVMLGIGVFFWRVRPADQRAEAPAGDGLSGSRAFAIALTEFWLGFPIELVSTAPLIPAECAWLLAFPLIVPNTPRRILVSSLLAASMGPEPLPCRPP